MHTLELEKLVVKRKIYLGTEKRVEFCESISV